MTVTALCSGPTKTEFQVRAGIAESLLFRKGVMTSAPVARIGYKAMMRGKASVVTGFSNKAAVLGMRFVPRQIAALISKKLNESR